MRMSSDNRKSKYDGVIIGLCPICGQNIRYPESLASTLIDAQERRLQAIDKPRRRSGRNPARSEGERIEEGFKMMEMDD
jgi:hypothetical protein